MAVKKSADTTAQTNDGYKMVNTSFFKFEAKGQILDGVFLGLKERQDATGKPDNVARIQEEDTDIVYLLGSAVLMSFFADMDINTHFRIVYKGKGKTKAGREINEYDLYVKE